MREPTNEEQRLMAVGGFERLEDFLAWMNEPTDQETLDKLDEPDWEELVLMEMGEIEVEPEVLRALQEQADDWMEEHPPKPL